jgi:ABC-type antimicrobial peptide transport system permease subunit
MAMRRFRLLLLLLLLLSLVVVVVVSLSPSSELDTSTIVFPTTQSLLVGSTESATAGGARVFFSL